MRFAAKGGFMKHRTKTGTIFVLSALFAGALAAGVLCACGEEKRAVTVVFKAAGSDDIVVSAQAGDTIAPPEVPQKIGNTGRWDHDGPWEIEDDMTIYASYETDGLNYELNLNGDGFIVDRGSMDRQTVELYIPSQHRGLPVEQIADNGFYSVWDHEDASLSSVYLPEGLTIIGKFAFADNTTLCSVTFPESTLYLRSYAFSRTGLKDVVIPKNVENIEADAFSRCIDLETVEFLSDATMLAENIFSDCENLISVQLPKNLPFVPDGAFSYCSSLRSIELPKSVSMIGNNAFVGCRALTAITVPKNVQSIGVSAFSSTTSLTEIRFGSLSETGVSKLRTIGARAFEACFALLTITIPQSVTSIGEYAFNLNTSLQVVEFEEHSKLNAIEENTFNSCYALSSINIPEGVLSIGLWAFCQCYSLSSITIPESVTNIDVWAFWGWTKDQTIYVKGRTEKPDGWEDGWSRSATVVWNA